MANYEKQVKQETAYPIFLVWRDKGSVSLLVTPVAGDSPRATGWSSRALVANSPTIEF